MVPLTLDDDVAENAVVVNICDPPSASRRRRNVSLYDACNSRQFFKRRKVLSPAALVSNGTDPFGTSRKRLTSYIPMQQNP